MSIFNESRKAPHRSLRCPSPERLAAYIDGTVGADQKRRLDKHLADCAFCVQVIAGEVSGGRRESPATPTWLRQKAEKQVEHGKSNSWRWAWAIGPALASLMVVAVLVKSPVNTLKTKSARIPKSSSSAVPSAVAARTPSQLAESTRNIRAEATAVRVMTPAKGAVLYRNQLRFGWTAAPNASYYKVRVMTTEGQLLWEGRTEQGHASVPASFKIAPGKYFVWVTAYLADGRQTQSVPVNFRVQATR